MLVLRGQDRHQMLFYTLEDKIGKANSVCLVEAFVEKIEPKIEIPSLVHEK